MLEHAIAKGHSVPPSTCLLITLMNPHLNGWRYRNICHNVWQTNVSSFLTSNFIVVSLEVHPKMIAFFS